MAATKKTALTKSSSKGLGKGLGKGINAWIPEGTEEEKVIIKEVVVKEPAETKLRISQIEPNKSQPRKMFDEDALIELSV